MLEPFGITNRTQLLVKTTTIVSDRGSAVKTVIQKPDALELTEVSELVYDSYKNKELKLQSFELTERPMWVGIPLFQFPAISLYRKWDIIFDCALKKIILQWQMIIVEMPVNVNGSTSIEVTTEVFLLIAQEPS